MHRVIAVIGKGLHVIENDPIYNEDRKTGDEPSCGSAGKIQRIKNKKEHQLVGFKPDKKIGNQEIK
jgi:hypothetical protein